jgi:hypothetical protein
VKAHSRPGVDLGNMAVLIQREVCVAGQSGLDEIETADRGHQRNVRAARCRCFGLEPGLSTPDDEIDCELEWYCANNPELLVRQADLDLSCITRLYSPRFLPSMRDGATWGSSAPPGVRQVSVSKFRLRDVT